VGQAVKTPPFHGGNTGSNPVRVTFLFIFYTYGSVV
ncbi:TPA_asm: ribosome maturation factor RimM, partial [Listeria monocytogenes]|nr:ribosome maturation factor RimM [Listeria monocytogenes]